MKCSREARGLQCAPGGFGRCESWSRRVFLSLCPRADSVRLRQSQSEAQGSQQGTEDDDGDIYYSLLCLLFDRANGDIDGHPKVNPVFHESTKVEICCVQFIRLQRKEALWIITGPQREKHIWKVRGNWKIKSGRIKVIIVDASCSLLSETRWWALLHRHYFWRSPLVFLSRFKVVLHKLFMRFSSWKYKTYTIRMDLV